MYKKKTLTSLQMFIKKLDEGASEKKNLRGIS